MSARIVSFSTAQGYSLETVSLTLAWFSLAGGALGRCVMFAAHFGRDTDRMAAMVGGIAGAFGGVGAIRPDLG